MDISSGNQKIRNIVYLSLLLIIALIGMAGCSQGEQKIAFHSGSATVDAEIYVVDLDGENLTQLTDSRGANANPAWSPDGEQIAFVSTRETNFEIYIMNADGSGQYNFTESSSHDRNPTWSPDGKWILFESRLRDTERRDLYIKHVDTGELVQLTDTEEESEFFPVWSPDGSQIAYVVGNEGNLDIYIMDKDGSSVENLTEDFGNADYPVWDPSGQILYFVALEEFEAWTREIFAFDLRSGVLSQVSFDGENKYKIFITLDGSKILFDSSVEIGQNENGIRIARSAIFMMNVDGTGLELLPIEIGANGIAWRP